MFSLWRKARRENSAASRLLGSTSLRFALHGWQRLKVPAPPSKIPFSSSHSACVGIFCFFRLFCLLAPAPSLAR
ncbi:hypothetical protein, partial [Thiolapillus sp.]|uniref:hypothetical protein n=1 Tax=Thiolapillus sp. TaxID=2017437 RepID=UPI003AF4792D